MKAGRALDALIAEHVFGWRLISKLDLEDLGYSVKTPLLLPPGILLSVPKDQFNFITSHIPRYSEDIAAAWEVLAKLAEKYEITFYNFKEDPANSNSKLLWKVQLREHYFTTAPGNGEDSIAESAPQAICLAALQAMGYKVKE